MTKAYRHTYTINEEQADLNDSEKNVPSLFKTQFMKDITSTYIRLTNVNIKSSGLMKDKGYAFLAIFGDKDQPPVCFGKVNGKRGLYADLGLNSLYIPCCYNDSGKTIPIGIPFVVSLNGKMKKINVNKKKRTDMVLKRNFPALGNSCRFLNSQASNDIEFKNHRMIRRVNECYGVGDNVEVPDSVPAYRYRHFFSTKPETHANVAEIYIFDMSGKELKGKVIGTVSSLGDKKTVLVMQCLTTTFSLFLMRQMVMAHGGGMDFSKPVQISHFYYCAIGSGIALAPNDKYELFYWDNSKWSRTGTKKAMLPTLLFKKVPSGGMYLLRKLTRGQEERIFTYENGKQIWWVGLYPQQSAV